MMEINYLLAGLYGKESCRYIFENLCALLILEKFQSLDSTLIKLEPNLYEESFFESTKGDSFSFNTINLGTNVYHIQARRGDGGLDILVEQGNEWIVFQCKCYIHEKIDKGNRPSEINSSFEKALATAKSMDKKIIKWVLCIPRDLEIKEYQWWENFKEKNHNKCDSLTLIQNKDITVYLLKYDHIFRYYFKRLIPSNLKMHIFIKLKKCLQKCESDLRIDQRIYNITSTSLSKIETYDSLFSHIEGMEKAFLEVYQLLEDIDKFSRFAEKEFAGYEANKAFMKDEEIEFAAKWQKHLIGERN